MTQGRGRPRNFDSDEVLDAALTVFWRNGFDAASLAELTGATGLTKPSLYAAFGDKEALYLKALERYKANWLGRHLALMESEPQGKRAIELLLQSIADMLCHPALPGGCFVVNGIADLGGERTTEGIEAALHLALQACERALEERLAQAKRDGHLPGKADVAGLAGFFYTVIAGMAVKAKAGIKREQLEVSIKLAMTAWPR
ncbi:TetR/AcrR family transcriptional regulator [Noviherbaspirillum sp.]|uniref:TetR/AcrR family transcriptional regulator n=1 Tax=Noviherbaspirillum sp. TaxID=1926288 RepID=UPI002FE2F454